jgi:hypothetical protein
VLVPNSENTYSIVPESLSLTSPLLKRNAYLTALSAVALTRITPEPSPLGFSLSAPVRLIDNEKLVTVVMGVGSPELHELGIINKKQMIFM